MAEEAPIRRVSSTSITSPQIEGTQEIQLPHPDGADVVEAEPDPVPTAVQSIQPTQRVQEEEKVVGSESDSGSYYDS